MRGLSGAALVFVCVILQVSAGQAQVPQHWRVVREGSEQTGAAQEFVMMPPGWHITTASSTLLFDSRRLLEDRFTVATELFLFPESTQDGYGIFIGGAGLDGNDARYLALQLRRDGSAAVLQRRGARTSTLIDWKLIPAVGPHPGKDTQRISMRIEVDSAAVRFTANGADVGSVPRTGLDLSGFFGFRMGRGINVHVVTLDISEKLAPPRR